MAVKECGISRCDLFFADKVIMVEGASERLLIPDMIQKCDGQGAFNSYFWYCLTQQQCYNIY